MKKRLKYQLIALTTSGILFSTSAVSALPAFAEDTAAVTAEEALTEENAQTTSGADENADGMDGEDNDAVEAASSADTAGNGTDDTADKAAANVTDTEASAEASTEPAVEIETGSEEAAADGSEEAAADGTEEAAADGSEETAADADTEEASAETTEETVGEETIETAEEITVYYSAVDESDTAIEIAESGSFTFTDSVVLSEMAPVIENYTYEGAYLDGRQVDTLNADDIEDEEITIEYHYQKDEEQPAEDKEITVSYSVTDTDGNPIDGQDGGQFTFSGTIHPEEMAPDIDGYAFDGAYINDEKTEELDASNIDGEEITLVFRYQKEEGNIQTVYTYEDDRVKVTATLSDPDAVPDNAVFRVTELPADFADGAYLDAANQNASSIDPEAAQAAAESGTETFTTSNTALYDIGFFVTEDGKEKEADLAEGTVSLELIFKQDQLTALGAESGEDVGLVHLPLADKDAYDTAQDATDITASDIEVDVVDSSASAGADTTDAIDVTLDNLSLVLAYSKAKASISLSSYSKSTNISDAAVDSITITDEDGNQVNSIDDYSKFYVTVAFSEDDSDGNQKSGLDIESGDTITVSWSSTSGAILTGYSDTIELHDKNTQKVIATAQITSSSATITFNDNVNSLQHVTGSVYFLVYAYLSDDVTNAEGSITSGNVNVKVSVTESDSSQGVIFSHKSAEYDTNGKGTITWSIWLNEDYRSDLTGNIVITDTLPSTESFDSFVYFTGKDLSGEWNGIAFTLNEFNSGDRSFIIDSDTNTITISIPASDLNVPITGLVVFKTKTTAEAGETVENTATVTYQEEGTDSAANTDTDTESVTIPSSGGTISGLPKGTIQVSKVVEGTNVPIAGITFRVYKLSSNEDSATLVSGWYHGADYVDIVTDSNGTASIADLNDGYYELEEISDSLPNWIAKSSIKTVHAVVSGTAGTSVTVGNSVVTGSITATKKWLESDGVTADTSDHPTVYFKLYRSVSGGDAEEVTGADILEVTTASGDSTATVTWGDLPLYDNSGNEYTYSVKEVDANGSSYTPEGYSKSEAGLTVTNTAQSGGSTDNPETDDSGSNGSTDSGSSGSSETTEDTEDTEDTEEQEETETTEDTEDTEEQEETETTEDTEETEDQEETSSTEDSENSDETEPVTPANATEFRTVHVQKRWADSDDVDGYRPDSITVQLYANGIAYGDPITISADNGWTFDWVNVPKDQFTVLVDYTVEEVSLPAHYTQFIEGDADTGITITNIRAEDGTWGIDDGTGDSYRVLGASRKRVKGASRDNISGEDAGDTTGTAGAQRSTETGDAPQPVKWFALMLSACSVLLVWTVTRKRRKNR